jgi:hypothetical protein
VGLLIGEPLLDSEIFSPTAAVAGVPVTVNVGDPVGRKVNEAVAVCLPCVPLVAITMHVTASVAVSELPVTTHPVLVVA